MQDDLTDALVTETRAGLSLARRQLVGLTDEEFWWKPVPGCWTVRPAGEEVPGALPPLGQWAIDGLFTYPDPAPLTTIGWRLNHMIIVAVGYYDVFAPPPDGIVVEGSADAAVMNWQAVTGALFDAVQGLQPDTARENVYIEHWDREVPRWTIVGHILREQIHHSAEIGCLRDLHRWRSQL